MSVAVWKEHHLAASGACTQTDDITLRVVLTSDLPTGASVAVRGVKYPLLFPSYSRTVTIAENGV